MLSYRPGSVLKPKPKPRFWGRIERKPKLRFWRGSKSVLTCRNGLTEDVADSRNDAVLNHFRSAEQRERVTTVKALWVGGRRMWESVHCRRLWNRASTPFPRPSSPHRPGGGEPCQCAPGCLLYPCILLHDDAARRGQFLGHTLHFT